ncbi:MAG: alpha/beta hydrolase [Bacilli bacterium]|nr:alpha/beta hydrolase [Bacilli bacterium]
MVALIIVLSLIGVILVFLVVAILIIYKMCFYNPYKNKERSFKPLDHEDFLPYMDKMNELLEGAFALPFTEYVKIKSFDGKKLAAKLYLHDEDAPFCIEAHGYRGSGIRDFSGGLVEFYNLGYNVLLIDHIGHGESSGKTITFGIKESKDVFEWIKYINERFNYPEMILYGISMGGNTVLNVSNMDLSANVEAIISDCPYTTPFAIISKVTKSMGINPKLAKPFIYMSAFFCAHVNLSKGDARKAVKETKVPILLIHGTKDLLVPHEMSKEIHEANLKDTKLLLVDGAPHGLSYLIDKEKVVGTIKEFLNEVKENNAKSQNFN